MLGKFQFVRMDVSKLLVLLLLTASVSSSSEKQGSVICVLILEYPE